MRLHVHGIDLTPFPLVMTHLGSDVGEDLTHTGDMLGLGLEDGYQFDRGHFVVLDSVGCQFSVLLFITSYVRCGRRKGQ